MFRGIPIKGARRRERLSMFVSERRYSAEEQKHMDYIYIPDDIEILD